MKKLKKALVLFLCAVLLVAGSVAGTLAYLLAQSEPVNNTFTVGNVEIYLDETDIDGSKTNYGDDELLHEGRDMYNSYTGANKLIPGKTVTKDPMVTVLAGSEDCYVRAIVTVDVSKGMNPTTVALPESTGFAEFFNNWANSFAGDYILNDKTTTGFNTTYWNVATTIDADAMTITYELRYKDIVTKSAADNSLPALFNDIKIPSELDSTTLAYLEDMTINVVAHAIQAEGFDGNAVEAWQAFDSQLNS